MADFVACLWRPGPIGATQERQLKDIRAGLEDADRWRLVHESPGLWVFSPPTRPINVRPLEDRPGVIVGDLFSSVSDTPLGRTAPDLGHGADLHLACTRLTRAVWGRYVAIFSTPERHEGGVFCGPVGGLECVAARLGPIAIAASRLPNAVLTLLVPALSIDWPRLANLAADTSGIGWSAPLMGVTNLAPGSLWRWTSKGEREDLIWRPGDFARLGWNEGDPAPILQRRIDSCVQAWSRLHTPVVAELSGGFDSAVVGASLIRAGADVRRWVNFYTSERTGDERRYARAVAEKLGIAVTEEAKTAWTFDPNRLADVSEGFAPSLNGLDAPYDMRMAAIATGADAQAIFTGQGGDILFYGMSTPLLAVDHVRRKGLAGLVSPFLLSLARRRRQSIWSLVRTALAGRFSSPRRAETALAHPWLRDDLSDLPPAKRWQLEQLVYCLRFFGSSRRARAAELVHPLLSQPIVELCLSIPADMLVEGGRDRGLARRAFADRLPAAVIDRRSKGDLTGFYGAAIARALPELRGTLIEGCLVAHGVLDARALGDLLDLDQLAVHGRHGDVMALAALEVWARCWQRRLDRARLARHR
jgi:asparagine synthase (glutamine-hydrolysing)